MTKAKIAMKTPLVEMDGDEMTRILWQMIKEKLILPYVDLKTEYYDLGLKHRDETDDQVTADSANAALRLGVAVKCATITPNAQRVEEYGLKKMWKSPNGTIRAMMDGTVFRTPILVPGISPCVRNWKKPITIARHAYGDVYKNTEIRVPGPGKAELCFTDEDGRETRETIMDFGGSGIIQGIHNTDKSILSFAHSCFRRALDMKQDLWFSAKDTISKTYDHRFKDIFAEETAGPGDGSPNKVPAGNSIGDSQRGCCFLPTILQNRNHYRNPEHCRKRKLEACIKNPLWLGHKQKQRRNRKGGWQIGRAFEQSRRQKQQKHDKGAPGRNAHSGQLRVYNQNPCGNSGAQSNRKPYFFQKSEQSCADQGQVQSGNCQQMADSCALV